MARFLHHHPCSVISAFYIYVGTSGIILDCTISKKNLYGLKSLGLKIVKRCQIRNIIVIILFAYVTEAQLISDPASLTRQIKKETTIPALLHTYCQYARKFNNIHLSACWTSLRRLVGQPAE